MIIEILVGLTLLLLIGTLSFIKNLIISNIDTLEFKHGYIPSKTGKYYIILNKNGKEIATVDTYNAGSMQWKNTKNPLKITHFAEY